MTATLDQLVITEPGVYEIPAEVYHADPVPGGSLSASGARRLLPPSCPALYRYEQDHPPAPRKVFEIGHAAHRLVLGVGPELVRIEAEKWLSAAVKAEVAAVRAAGAVPLKPDEWDTVHAMAAALRAHPIAAALLAPGSGQPEQSLFWRDHHYGEIWRRARLDWLPSPRDERLIIADYKTCQTAAPDDLPRAINAHGYHQTAAWYLDGVRTLGLAESAAFVLVFQEKTPPYLVNVVEPNPDALRIGRSLNRDAIRTYRECTATGRWPGYSDDVTYIGLPPWVEAQYSHREVW